MAERTIDAQRASATVRARRRRVPRCAANTPQPRCCRAPHPDFAGGARLGKHTHARGARAQVPRDTAQLYKQLAESGLQYGPAFRLLRNVHVPDTTA